MEEDEGHDFGDVGEEHQRGGSPFDSLWWRQRRQGGIPKCLYTVDCAPWKESVLVEKTVENVNFYKRNVIDGRVQPYVVNGMLFSENFMYCSENFRNYIRYVTCIVSEVSMFYVQRYINF